MKRELHEFCDGQSKEWDQTSLETLQAQQRLATAQLLMHRLGIKAHGPTESDSVEPEAAV